MCYNETNFDRVSCNGTSGFGNEVEWLGILYMALASLLYGIAPSIQNALLLRGLSPIALVVVSNGFAALFSLVLCLVRRQSLQVSPKQLLQLLLVGGVGMGVTEIVLNLAYLYLPVGFVTMIHFMFPALVCFAMAAFFHETLTLWKLGGVVLSLVGLVLISGGGFSGQLVGILLALVSSVTYGFFLIANDKLSIRGLPQMTLTFYISVAVVLVNLVCAQFTHNRYPADGQDWLLCALVGAMFCGGITLIDKGIAKLGAGTSAFFNMLEPVISLVVSAVVYRYAISPASGFGCVLILASMLFAARGSAPKPRQPL